MITETRTGWAQLLSRWQTICRTCSLPPDRDVDVVSRWLVVSRACVQPMTLIAASIAGLLAVRAPGFEPGLLALSALGLVLAHAANNMINDYFDLKAGLDTSAYPRALYAPHPVLAGLIGKRTLLTAILVVNAADAAIMLVLFTARGWPILAFAFAGLFISFFYVAPPLRLKARALGELSVVVVWGPLMIGGTFYAAAGTLPSGVLWASLPYSLLVGSVLMGKHIDKAPWDEPQKIRTLPVLLGGRRARTVTLGLIGAFYPSVAALVAVGVLSVWTLCVAAAAPLAARAWRVYREPRPPRPPKNYPVWPLWFSSWAFVHTRRAGTLLVVGLLLGAVRPVAIAIGGGS